MYFIVHLYLLVRVARKTKQAIILNLCPLFITYTFIHVCGCIYDPVVMQIIYLTFNMRTVLGMGSNSPVGKNTSVCISCLQPWNNLANTMLNQRAILIELKAYVYWYMPPPYLLILNLSLCNHYSRWMSWFESISYLQLHGHTCWLIF